jgi:hypothetical protein
MFTPLLKSITQNPLGQDTERGQSGGQEETTHGRIVSLLVLLPSAPGFPHLD